MIWIIATAPLMLLAVLVATLPLLVTMARERRAEQAQAPARVQALPGRVAADLEDVAA